MLLIMGKVSHRKREESETVEYSVLVDGVIAFTEPEIPTLTSMLARGGWIDANATDLPMMEAPPPAAAPAGSLSEGLSITVPQNPTHDMIARLREIFRAYPGRARVFLLVESGGEMRKVSTEYSVELSLEVVKKVKEVVGEENVKV